MNEDRVVVLIPAYKPDERMPKLCGELRANGLAVLLVDDGSGAECAPLFAECEAMGCAVERHAINLGKGRALKTGINAAMNRFPGLSGLVTADADGQHTCRDILRIIEQMKKTPRALVTGARAFHGEVPFKSRAGNAITKQVYRFVSGVRCTDTQTGLRGIPAEALAKMLTLKGERYEYEMNMLLHLRDMRLPLVEVPIDTIYIDDNRGSHFHPMRDATRIYLVILTFLLSSLLSFGVDYLLYLFLLRTIGLDPWASYAVARVVSAAVNFSLNRMAVFGGRGGKGAILRYYLLATVQLAVGAGLVEALSRLAWLSPAWVKIPVDCALFVVSYILQRDFVFGEKWKREQSL